MEKIYFFSLGDLIKIGVTAVEIKRRMREVEIQQSKGPIKLIGSIPGSFQLERAIHAKLVAHRSHGEWFTDCPEVRTCIDGLMTEGCEYIEFDQSTSRVGKCARERSHIRSTNPETFGRVARIIWPDTAIRELCALSDADEMTVSRWLNGLEQPPRIVRLAFGAVVTAFIVPDGYITSFLDCKPDQIKKLPIEERVA